MAEAVLGWLMSVIVSTLIVVALFTQGNFTSFVPQRPGGHLGRTAAQVATDQELADTSLPVAVQLLLLLPGWIVLLAVPWVLAGIVGKARPGWTRAFERSDIGMGIGWGIALQLPILFVVALIMQLVLGEFEPSGRALTIVDSATSPALVVLLVLSVGVGAPIVEEIFYRGLVQPALIRSFGVPAGIAVASLIFGAVHMSLIELFPLSVVGLVFGILAHRTGRLAAPIIAHMTFNLYTLVVLLLS